MKNKLHTAVRLGAACISIAITTGTVFAEAQKDEVVLAGFFGEDVGGSERINFSGKLRMLSQRIASASCHLNLGIEADGARNVLMSGLDEFQNIVHALEFGDDSLGIKGAESRRKTLVAIEDLKSHWAPFYAAVQTLLKDPADVAALAYISENNMKLLDSAKLLVSEISGQYSNPAEMTQAHAMLVDISGRQRMLLQKISKETCALSSQNAALGTLEVLEATKQMFETSMLALKDGLPAAGITPPPTDEIQSGLNEIWQDWQIVRDDIQHIKDEKDPDGAFQADTFRRLNVELKEMNAVVGLYAAAAKQSR